MGTRRHSLMLPALAVGIMLFPGCRSASVSRIHAETHQEYTPAVPQGEVSSSSQSKFRLEPQASENHELTIRPVSHSISSMEPVSPGTDATTSSDSTSAVALPLPQLCAIAVSSNPDLVTLRQTERVSLAAKGVADTYPFNPFVQVQATPFQDAAHGGPNRMYHYVLLMQTIQLAHQQDFREQGARFALNSTRWNIHQAELLTLAQAHRLYFTTLYQRGIRELAEASHENNLDLLQILENQLDAGAATAADVAIVRVDASSTRQQEQLATANFQNALRDLARHIGIQPNSLPNVVGDLHEFRWQLPDLSSQHAESSQNDWNHAVINSTKATVGWAMARPDVMAARSEVDVARANLGLASAAKTPDLQVGPYYQATADNTSFLGFRAQMDLPVVNNGEPLERQRLAEHHQRITAWHQAQRRAELEATAAMDRYADSLAAVETETSDQQSSDLPTELKGLEKQFLAGEVDVVRVVQARNSLILNRRVRLDLLNELSQAAAGLVGATGIPIETIVQLDDQPKKASDQ